MSPHRPPDDPYTWYDTWTNALGPIRLDFWGQSQVLFRYEDCLDALSRSGLSADRAAPLMRYIETGNCPLGHGLLILRRWFQFLDGRVHRYWRTVIGSMLVQSAGPGYEQTLHAAAATFLDRIDGGQFEAIQGFCRGMAELGASRIVGVSEESGADRSAWARAVSNVFGSPHPTCDDVTKASGALQSMCTLLQSSSGFQKLYRAAVANLPELPFDDFVAQGTLLLVAGHETTQLLLGNCLYVLQMFPDLYATLRSNFELLPAFVNEVLRHQSPTQFAIRVAEDDISIKNTVIEKGTTVVIALGAANRDESVFSHACDFDIFRRGPRHLAFGFGAHHCPGSQVSMTLAVASLQVLLERFKRIELAADPVWQPNPMFRGPAELRVRLD